MAEQAKTIGTPPPEKICRYCFWYLQTELDAGQCRRNAPVLDPRTKPTAPANGLELGRFPGVMDVAWCGQWKFGRLPEEKTDG